MRYVKAKYKEYIEAYAYRIYISDSIYNFMHGKTVEMRYVDMLTQKPQINKSGDEIVLDIMTRGGLKFENEA